MDEKTVLPAAGTLSDADRDNILLLYQSGLTSLQISQITKVSRSAASAVSLAYERAKANDAAGIRKSQALMKNIALMRWACKRANVDYDELMDAAKGYTTEKKDAPQNKPPADMTSVEDAVQVAARLIQDSLTTELRSPGEKIDRLATILQSCSANETNQTTANHDTLFKEVQKQTELLSWIKTNTRVLYSNQIK